MDHVTRSNRFNPYPSMINLAFQANLPEFVMRITEVVFFRAETVGIWAADPRKVSAVSSPNRVPDKATARRTTARRIGALVGVVEVLALVGLTVAAALAAPTTSGWTSGTSKGHMAISEVIVYLLFAAGVAAVTWFFWHAHARAWTPFSLVQAFALVAAWPLVQSDVQGYRLAGIGVMALALIGLGAAIQVMRRAS
jgi:hypothetical protein